MVGGLLDLVMLYDCNLACDYCTITPAMRRQALTTEEILQALRQAKDDGFDRLSITGGEPTLRRDLLGVVKAARKLGFGSVKVQSNGLLLGQRQNVERLQQAGVSLFHVSIHTLGAERYDTLVRRQGSYSLMIAAIDNLVAAGAELVIDVILKEDTYRRLPDTVAQLHHKGCRNFDLWFVSLTDHNAANVDSLPRMSDVVPYMTQAFAYGRRHGLRVRSLHVPRCLLGEDHRHAFDPGSERVRVVTPRATFDLSRSRLAGSRQVTACEGCRFEAFCPGLREDYLARYGDGEVIAVPGDAAAPGGSAPRQQGALEKET